MLTDHLYSSIRRVFWSLDISVSFQLLDGLTSRRVDHQKTHTRPPHPAYVPAYLVQGVPGVTAPPVDMPLATSRIPLIGDREMDDTPHSVPSDVGMLDRNSLGSTSPASGRHSEDSPPTMSTSPELSVESVTPGGTSREAVRCREKRQRRKERERLLLEVTCTRWLCRGLFERKQRKRRAYLLASMTTVVVAVNSGIYLCTSATCSI